MLRTAAAKPEDEAGHDRLGCQCLNYDPMGYNRDFALEGSGGLSAGFRREGLCALCPQGKA